MLKRKILVLGVVLSLLLVAVAGCNGTAAPSGQTFDVKRGDLDIVVSTDGSLYVPNNYNLKFGTTGTVQNILVQEGDKVKAGALLAFLDNTTQKNAIKTALFNIRTAANNINAGANGSNSVTITYQPPDTTEWIKVPDTWSQWTQTPDPMSGWQPTVPVVPVVPVPTPYGVEPVPGSPPPQYNTVPNSTPMQYNLVPHTVTPPPITITSSIPTCSPFDLPNNYPDLSAPLMFQEAQKDLDLCISNFTAGQYMDAGSKLGMAYFDLDACQDLIANRQNPAALAGAKINSTYNPDGTPGSSADMWPNDANVVDYLKKFQARLLNISSLIMQGASVKAKAELTAARDEMALGNSMVENTVHLRGRTLLEYPDTPTSLDFLQLSMRSLQDLDKYMAQDNVASDEVAKRLYTAMLNLSIGADVLQNQNVVCDINSGFNWKSLQQYNLALQNAKTALYKAKQDMMNTVIVAPSDGTVVAVQLKKGYPLSAQDYSSRTAIQLVDTRTIKFTGNVDEIDIVKVKQGQKVKLTIDAVPGKTFTGTVSFISPFGTKQGQVIRFPVTILLDPTDVELRGGLSTTADISVYSAKNAILVPISVIIRSPQGPTIMVINPTTGVAEPRKVTVGKQNSQQAEILSGLQEGEKVTVLTQKPATTGDQRTPPPPGMFR